MKNILTTLLILLFSIPTAMANSLIGQHVWCLSELDPAHSIGLSFTDSGAEYWYLNGYNVAQSFWAVRDEADSIYLRKQGSDEDYVIDRNTLRDVSGRQCSIVSSSGEIMSKMLAIAREALANN